MLALGCTTGVAIAYFLAARLGLALLTEDVAVFWPASGIAVGILVVLGRRARAAVVVGVIAATIIANLMGDRSLWTSVLKGFCNAGEAVLTAWLIERWFGRAFAFDDVRHVLGFVAAAALGVAASAFGGAATMTLLHTAAPFWDVWRAWFLADGVGIVVVAPLVIGLGQLWRERPSRGEWIEGVGVLALLSLTSLYAVSHPAGSWVSFSPGALVLPFLLWLTARCRPAFAIAGAFVASAAVLFGTTFGIGRFGDASVAIAERVKGAQAAMTVVTLYTLILTALFAARRRNEAALKESERRFRLTADAAPVLVWISGIDKLCTWFNKPWLDFVGRTMEQELGNGWSENVHADDFDRCLKTYVDAFDARQPFSMEYRLRRHDGEYRWVLDNGIPLWEPAGEFAGYIGSCIDITERKQAELTDQQLAAIVNSSHDAIVSKDLNGIITTWNRGAERLFGYAASEMIGRSITTLIPPDRHHEEVCILDRIRRGERVDPYETLRQRRDGSLVDVSLSVSPLRNAAGEVIGASKIARDITERKKAELALAERNLQLALAERAALVGSAAHGADSERMQISAGYAAIHGFPAGTREIMRSEWKAGVHPDDLARLEELRNHAFRTRSNEYSADYRIVRPGGEVRWIDTRVFISYRGDGHPQRVVGVNIDVTGRKRAEEQQCTLLAELDHRVKNALATVSAVVSHTQQGSRSVADFVAALDGRIRSMATTHELLSSIGGKGCC